MKKLWLGILATLLVTIGVAPAFAWEFDMKGQFEWRFRYFGRANGYQDLFGDMRFQDNPQNSRGAIIGFSGLNMWRGFNGGTVAAPNQMNTSFNGSQLRIVRGGFSNADSDAFAHDQRMTFSPTLRVNKAIEFIINMDLASVRQKYNHRDYQTNGPLDRWYQDRTSANAFDTAMIPSINQYKLKVALPYGTLSLGAKDFMVGTGAQWGYNSRGSALVFLIPYGPFVITPQLWLARRPDGYGAFSPYGTSAGPGANTVNNYDGGEHANVFFSPLLDYYNGPFTFGCGYVQNIHHFNNANLPAMRSANIQGIGTAGGIPGANGPATPPANAGRTVFYNNVRTQFNFWAEDWAEIEYLLWAKYNNGRVFANAEYDWGERDFYYPGGAPQVSNEYYLAFAEAGVMCGPAKLAFMFASSGGSALNNNNPTKNYTGNCINNITTDNYNYLLFHNYGGGNDAPWASLVNFTQDEVGQLQDAVALAARLDYAVAANLNIWGSYLWATRAEQNGWLAGSKNADGVLLAPSAWGPAEAQAWKAAAMPGAGPASGMNPYVDDNFLGWEAGCGIGWKLLENMTFAGRYAYWQPGPWFDQAYQVVGQTINGPGPTFGAAGATGAAANNNGAFMQGRSAIQAIETSILVDF